MFLFMMQNLYRGWWIFFWVVIFPLFIAAILYIIIGRMLIKPPLGEGEQIKNRAAANLVKGSSETTGRIFLTSRKIYYNSYKRTKEDEVIILLEDVKDANLIGEDTDSNIQVNLKDGTSVVFSIWSRAKWIERINELAS